MTGPAEVVAVIGGGPAGLAAAATLKPLGLHVRVLEKEDAVGARWRNHYDRLHLHTTRGMSGLPGMIIPREYGRWVARDDFATYQEDYARHHQLDVELGTSVLRVERVDDRWRVTTSKGTFDASYVVVGAGYNNVAYLPTWPGSDTFTGELVHSQKFRTGAAYKSKRVVVVGTGNSGAELATDLAEQGAEVWWSVRTPPTILRRALLGIATQAFGVVLRPLSPKIVDPIVRVFARITVGSLSDYGLPPATRGAYTAVLHDRVLPILDVGLVREIKSGHIRPIGTIASFDGASVVFADGECVEADAVIACTGFRPALEPIVGHLGVLDACGLPTVHGADEHPDAPGMYFLGYSNAISGNLREISTHARKLARVIERARKRASVPLLEHAL